MARLAAFRVIVTAWALFDVVVLSEHFRRYAVVDEAFYNPIFLLRVLNVPRAGQTMTTVAYAILVCALVAGMFGMFTRAALLVAAPLYTWWYAVFFSFGKINHGQVAVVVALTVLAIAPSGAALSLDARRGRMRREARPGERVDELAGWALRVVTVIVVLTYLFAAYAKLVRSGLGWVTGPTMEFWLVDRQATAGELLLDNRWALPGVQVVALAIEACAFCALLRSSVRYIWLATAALFHVGTLVFLDINFIGLVVCYAAFLPLEKIVDRGLRRSNGGLAAASATAP